MSFTNVPVTKTLVTSLVALSILASLLDIKHSFYILTDLHLWRYGQLWRIPIFQLCYSNATEVLFGSMTLYSLRAVERLWGSRKFASFLITSYVLTSILVPLIQVFLVAPLSHGRLTYIPSGPTPLIFAILAQYHAMVPHLYEYRIAFSPSASSSASRNTNPTPSSSSGGPSSSSNPPPPLSQTHALTFSDKSAKYLPPTHLFLSSLPISPLLALIGWTLGYVHRTDGLLPPRVTRWRVPRWLVGDSSSPFRSKPREGFEGLQRRLVEQEGGAAAESSSSGVSSGALQQQGQRIVAGSGSGNTGSRRRNMGQQILDQFRGAF